MTKPRKDMTIEDLQNIVWKYDGLHYALYENPADDDISSVNFDTENMEQFGTEYSYNHLPGLENLDGYEMLGKEGESAFPVLWVAAGGDWELPLVFILFIGEDGKLHGYVPEDGKAYPQHDAFCIHTISPRSAALPPEEYAR